MASGMTLILSMRGGMLRGRDVPHAICKPTLTLEPRGRSHHLVDSSEQGPRDTQ